MTWILRILDVSALLTLSSGTVPAWAYGMQALENPWTLCAQHIQKQEREKRIPRRLLRAVALAESGRWHPDTGEISAWPWTVMAKGKGRFFDNKQQALRWVRKLQAEGVTNIDVGCMQVNLYHHGFQFPSLEHALDPEHNTAYAAKFLREKFTAARSWTVAAGHYHSTNPDKNTPYRRKVLKFWHGPSRDPSKRHLQADNKSTMPPHHLARIKHHNMKLKLKRAAQMRDKKKVAINHDLMTKLNTRFQQNLAGLSTSLQMPGDTQAAAPDPSAAFKSKRSVKKIIRRGGNGMTKTFARKRRAQLDLWRRTKAWRAHQSDG